MEQNAEKLEKHLKDSGINPAPESSDMIFIKELINGGPLIPDQV